MTHTNITLPRHAGSEAIPAPHKKNGNHTLFHFMATIIRQLRQRGKYRTSETYQATLRSFTHFRGKEDVRLSQISSELMVSYETWLSNHGLTKNTSSFYLRILRATYNRAVEQGLTADHHPFRHVYTGVDKTMKRAIPTKAIKKIKQLDLSANPTLDLARDLFLFSFYTRGMSFIDMAYLRKTDLSHGILTYRRRKTSQQLIIKWERCMQEITDKHPSETDSPYLLPILDHRKDNHRQYRNIITRTNRHLKEIAKRINLPVPLTLYVARHSWASIAHSKHIPLSVISEGMGHNSERTTRIYLASLDNSVVDRANAMILKDL